MPYPSRENNRRGEGAASGAQRGAWCVTLVPSDRSLGAVLVSLLKRRAPLPTPHSVPSVSFAAFLAIESIH